MMETSTRLRTESAFHERQAQDRAADLRRRGLAFGDEVYLDHASWIRPALARLGDVRGKSVLDLGCGHGMAAVVLARCGARVTGLELSAGYLHEARARAAANGVTVRWVQADAERLPFADASFDAVWGNAILHHLDVATAARELHRVLHPAGVAVLCEPWGGNPLLRWARSRLPYPRKQRTPDETPLTRAHVITLGEIFGRCVVEGHELLGMMGRFLGPGRRLPGLARWDGWLLDSCPALGDWCRYVVLALSKST
jgi:2-polyprenyl-3-methyl-5-hydroxy-6-metoxy-1,4-benzoquinol methylase